MAGVYEIRLMRPDGTTIQLISEWSFLTYSKVINGEGFVDIVIPSGLIDIDTIDVDCLLEIWRAPEQGADLQWETTCFINRWVVTTQDNETMVQLTGPGQLNLIGRRVVRYNRTTAEAAKSGLADDVMKEYVTENVPEPITDPYYSDERGIPNFTVAADEGRGPNVGMEAGWEKLLYTLQKIAEAAHANEAPIYFDVVRMGVSKWEFRTYADQRGIDRTTGTHPIQFSQDWGNLENPRYEQDWSEDENIVHGLGWGTGEGRVVDPERDKWRLFRNLYARREGIQDARGCTTLLQVATRAAEKMGRMRPRIRFSGRLMSTPETLYGRDWYWGDKVMAVYQGRSFAGLVEEVLISVNENGKEYIDALLEAEYFADIELGLDNQISMQPATAIGSLEALTVA